MINVSTWYLTFVLLINGSTHQLIIEKTFESRDDCLLYAIQIITINPNGKDLKFMCYKK